MEIMKHSVCCVFHIRKEFMYQHDVLELHHMLYPQPPSARETQGTEHVITTYLFCPKSDGLAYIVSEISLSNLSGFAQCPTSNLYPTSNL